MSERINHKFNDKSEYFILLKSQCVPGPVLGAGVKGTSWHVGFNNWHSLKKILKTD